MTEDVPGYRVLDRAGEGGFSVVYRARQERLDRLVALKVLSVHAVDDAALRRFQRECTITAKLSGHPNVVTVLDTGTTRAGSPYIAMEYFEHGALADRLDREGPLPVADALRVGVKIAGALAAVHEIDVLHRDIKPQNILVSRYGEPALADFGIARLVDSLDAQHTQAFTPHHAAPEVLEGRPAGVGSDLYSLGSTLYQLLAGRPAFKGPKGEGMAQLMLRILNDPPPPFGPHVPPGVHAVIARAMAKAPADRYPDAVTFAQALRGLQADLGLPVTDLAYGTAGGAVDGTGGGIVGGTFGGTGGGTAGSGGAVGGGAVSGPGTVPAGSDVPPPPPVPDWASTAQVAPPAPAVQASPWQAPVPQDTAPPDARHGTVPGPPGTRHGTIPGSPGTLTGPSDTRPGTLPGRSDTRPGTVPGAPDTHPGTVPGPPARRDGPRPGLIIAASVALVGGLAAGVGALVWGGGGKPSAPPATQAATPVASAAPSADTGPIPRSRYAETRPRGVVVRPYGTTAALSWKLPAASRQLAILVLKKPADGQAVVSAGNGAQAVTVTGLNARRGYCFRVGTLLRVNQGKAADVSWSAPVCVRGARTAR
ncbi:serine/threonine-protein kinase [Actinomadura rayongensis]|uniref:non-specific serine/threonine protein kinase n=1 Tax=Actinomadura rayongensis TaxID=1429076 RepID=A0A6I4WCS6_9ACTN|nr:serine/threonine-protein kinase [Actinomadura rayongensis]MXQ67431.1 protein kinase [Actinomadura rayongensis]